MNQGRSSLGVTTGRCHLGRLRSLTERTPTFTRLRDLAQHRYVQTRSELRSRTVFENAPAFALRKFAHPALLAFANEILPRGGYGLALRRREELVNAAPEYLLPG